VPSVSLIQVIQYRNKHATQVIREEPVSVEMRTAEDWLRDRQLRVTAQRRMVLALMLDNPGRHWTADALWEAVHPRLTELARGTIYNVLNELVRVELVEQLPTREGGVRYGLRMTPHHHLVCDRCRQWFDVEPDGVAELRLAPRDAAKFHVTGVEVIFHGTCWTCAHAVDQ